MKTKPIVKYRQVRGTFAGEKYKHRYKLTLLATIKGPEADALGEAAEGCKYWTYDDKKHIVKIYEEKLLDY